MTRPVDHHGHACPDRIWPLHPAPWNMSADEAKAFLKERGAYVSPYPNTNWISAAFWGVQWRSADERARLQDIFKRMTDPVYRAEQQLAAAQEEIAALKKELEQCRSA